jgi:hypothetical protein
MSLFHGIHGSIIDKTIAPTDDKFDEYWHLEAEANRFASELLMPNEWARGVIDNKCNNIKNITEFITREADVSSHAATIKIKDTIGEGYIFAAITDDNEVIFSGKSEGTHASPPMWGEKIYPEKMFPFCRESLKFEINGFFYYWWHFTNDTPIPIEAIKSDWRKLLDEIIFDIKVPLSDIKHFKQSINGVISHANSRVRGENRSPESLYSAALQRIHGHSELKKFIKHPKFESFIYSKIDSLLNR